MGSINKQISRFETTAVYTHPDAKVDVVLVHGLNGEPQKTWTAKNDVFWPTDLLPGSLRDAKANVLVYGYNADVYSKKHGGNPSDNFIYMHAQTLVTSLTHYRKDEMSSRNPIIWVCHSLGGILLKRALLYSNDLKLSQHEDYRGIYVSTYGIIFLGTPHTGSDMGAWAVTLQAMSDAVMPRAFWHSESVLLKTLKKDNETLQNINNHFLDIYQRFKIMFAHENHATDLKGTKMLVVDSQSASPQLPGVGYFAIEATHSGMCKFDSKNAPGYRTVATSIRDWVIEAPDVISTRWRVEDDEKLARAKHEIEERMKPWLKSQAEAGAIQDPNNQINSPTDPKSPSRIGGSNKLLLREPEPEPEPPDAGPEPPSQDSVEHTVSREPIFVKPSVFKPNTFFKGREKEMKELHRKLMDPGRRSRGTSSVLIQSMPGGGKTHLARQYVFEHKYQYPGGIFWIRSKSVQELEYGYWDIAKTVQLKEVQDLDQEGFNDTKKMVKAVQGWLSRNEGWLLVLDGVHFDLPGLEDFIPLAKNTSIIFTSTEKTAGEDYQFDNPQVIVLDSLTPREAQELLLEEMGKKKPWNQDDLSRAMELVQLMDRLPLMIHVAALQLKATREPLSKYLRSYKSRPKAGNLPAYRAVHEQLQHRGNIAALNLMSLLAFFSQHVPVEMLALGLKALTRETPVKTYDPEARKGSLNNTFKILIAFALIERNESDEASSASDRSSRSVDTAQDNLDILRLHGIVQAFFVDILSDEKLAHFWLERAIRVFCRAFDKSDRRIQEDKGTGVPEDYLRFSIHGKKLSEYLDRFERKHPELSDSRELLETRLDSIQLRIDQLTKRKKAIDQGVGEVSVVSVFERINSLSELDSSTPPSSSSLIEMPIYDESNAPLESPTPYSPGDYNPYHWHVTFPYGIAPPADVDISRTVTPQPAPTEIFESISVPEDYDLNTLHINHRTLKRHSERRYWDTSGAWQASPQILSDPRVSLSRETVKGVITPPTVPRQRGGRSPSSGSIRLTASSDAEMTLNKITRAAPPLSRGGGIIRDKSRTSSAGSSVLARPQLIPGRPSYSNVKAEAALYGEHPIPTFSNVMGTSSPPSSSYTAATLSRLKVQTDKVISTDGLAPIKVSSTLTADPLTTTSGPLSLSPPLVPPYLVDLADTDHPTQPGSRRSSPQPIRSARSSPSQHSGPFPPPPIPIEINSTSSLYAVPGASSGVRHATSYGRLNDSAIYEDDYEPLAYSFPSARPYPPSRSPSPPYPHNTGGSRLDQPAVSIHPPPWTASDARLDYHTQGYWSQPMSRDPSHQSSHSHGSAQSQPVRNRSPLLGSLLIRGRSAPSSPGLQTMQRPRSRRPSVVETEPSPRLGTAGFDVDPASYQVFHESARGRPRAGSGTIPQGQAVLLDNHSRPGFLRRFSRRRRSGNKSNQHRRAESAGGRLIRGGLVSRSSPRVSPDLQGTSDAFVTGDAGVTGGEAVGRGEEGVQNMAKSGSGSGGFKLADGSMVQFGTSPAGSGEAFAGMPSADEQEPGERRTSNYDIGLGILD